MKIFNLLGRKYYVDSDTLVLSMPPNNHIAVFTNQGNLDNYSIGNKFISGAKVLNAVPQPQITTDIKPIIYTEDELKAYRLWAFNTGIFPDINSEFKQLVKKQKVNINDDMDLALSQIEEEQLFSPDIKDYNGDIIKSLRENGFPESYIVDALSSMYNKAMNTIKIMLENEVGVAVDKKFLPDAKHKSITGWDTMAEYSAYHKGRQDEEDVLIAFVEKWTGQTNSALGALLNSKFKNMAAQN